MNRNPAPRRRPSSAATPARRQWGGTLAGIFVGLVIGMIIAAGLVWYLNRTPTPFQDKRPAANENQPTVKPSGKQSEPSAPAAPVANNSNNESPASKSGPEPLPGKPGDKPRFEFYDILPGKQNASANGEKAAEKPAEKPAEKASDPLYLQAGAFQKAGEADNLKAKLAMMGVEASVQEVTVPDKGKMLRVRVGPFSKPEEMNKVRNELSANGIQATVVKNN